MKNLPRFLPLAGVAVAGVLGLKLASGAGELPELVAGARAFAEEAPGKAKAQGGDHAKAESAKAPTALPPSGAPAAAKPPTVCAPTAAELAKQAGLSPAELQILQTLGTRRGQLDQRESDIDAQLQLLAAAEAKVEAKLKAVNGVKAEIKGLMGQIDAQQQAETDRMVIVFSGMKPKDAAARMTVLSDAVRLPIAAKMKERALSAMLAQMSPADAKALTEKLVQRYADATARAQAALNPPATAPAAPKGPKNKTAEGKPAPGVAGAPAAKAG